MTEKMPIVMLAGRDESSTILYNALKGDFEIEKVVMEDPVPRRVMLQRRIRRLGLLNVAGQVLFMLWNKLAAKRSAGRIAAIKKMSGMDETPIDPDRLLKVSSINEQRVIDLLRASRCKAAVVNGTRIISEAVLGAVEVPFINIHVGITPKYRGVHGGYWALADDDAEYCGVTVHLVDTGIDTGDVLAQARIEVTEEDGFNTYPYLQLARAVPLLRDALLAYSQGKPRTYKVDLPSRIWYHPTLWEYIFHYMTKRVK